MSDTATQTVNAEAVDDNATTPAGNQPNNTVEMGTAQSSTSANPTTSSDDINFDIVKKLIGLSESAAINLIDAYSPSQWLQGIRLLNNLGRRDALKDKLPESVYNHFVKTVCYKTQLLAYETNEAQRLQFNVTNDGGVYIQAPPLGGLGLEVGIHAKTAKDGERVSHRVAAGFYLRHTEYKGCELTAEQRKAIADDTAALLA